MIHEFVRMDDEPSEYARRLFFEQTQIWKDYPEFCEANFAKHPVIFLHFDV